MSHLDPAEVGETPCKCGRILRKIHCPECGAYWTRFLRREKRTPHNSTQQQDTRVFLCRGCGFVFDEFSWGGDLCEAPPYATKAVAKRERNKQEAQKAIASLGESTLEQIASDVFSGNQESRMEGLRTLFKPVEKLKHDQLVKPKEE